MRVYSLVAAAKINLYLEIVGDREDGYHELVTVFQSLSLSDRVEIRASGTEQIRVHCDHPLVPSDESNLAYKAARLMCAEFPDAHAQYGGIEIAIDKQIPVAAGLAGGSTNAAAVLVGIDLLWELGLTQPEMQTLAARLGSDVPFCVSGGTMLATGRGEELNSLPGLDGIPVVLAKPRQTAISTAWVYRTYREQFGGQYWRDREEAGTQGAASELMSAIANHDRAAISRCLYNDLEKVVLPAYPDVARLRDVLQAAGASGVLMSGSGSTVFALCESPTHAEQVEASARAAIADELEVDFWVVQLSGVGIRVASH